MSGLSNKRIILGITGGIAAYKGAEIVRRLQDQGAEVRVVMTAAATEFIRPLTLQALSGYQVHTDLLDAEAEAAMGHIELARWADLLLIAPATANFISTMVHGGADSLLSAVYLATSAKIAVAPAMNQAMWSHTASQQNIQALKGRETIIIEPDTGIQACGDIGPGRLQQPEIIVDQLKAIFESGLLAGKKVVITAGPTREAIDPVRYISNHSSGKMGYALAAALTEAGAKVVLISGPVLLDSPAGCELISVVSADAMLNASVAAVKDANIFISAAAVADYRAVDVADQKIKKQADNLSLELKKNPDIVSTIATDNPQLFVVGFAAETENIETFARDKLVRKKLHAIIANDVSRQDIGFNADDNEVSWIDAQSCKHLGKKSKSQLARDIVKLIAANYDG
ncbi:MAG: bifunctional phosphopantothenoylcysteine decarboxylase/phosphopantothenate--cysteine ligase CoaBC [Porticoccaceae bacterium]|nr:bifunctional phosphopantothenoylcysteine decarboxylase/phosphopantothenate--cysteine ligase CoaBC [Porticoccaceae bacterium]